MTSPVSQVSQPFDSYAVSSWSGLRSIN